MLRLAFVDGATPAKWARIWGQRHPEVPLELSRVTQREQLDGLHDGSADVALVRLPVDPDGLSVIPLYSEVAVAVAAKDHAIAAAAELTLADIAGEQRVSVTDDLTDAQVMELVAAGIGIVVVPHSIARLHARKDTIARPVTDAPETRIALAWPTDATTPEIEEFVGVVRGRTANSSRGAVEDEPAAPASATRAPAKGSKAAQGTKGGSKPAQRQQPGRGARSPRNSSPSRGRRRRG